MKTRVTIEVNGTDVKISIDNGRTWIFTRAEIARIASTMLVATTTSCLEHKRLVYGIDVQRREDEQ